MSEAFTPRTREEVRLDSILRAMQSNLRSNSSDGADKIFRSLGLNSRSGNKTSFAFEDLVGKSPSASGRVVRSSPALKIVKQLIKDQEEVKRQDKERIKYLEDFYNLQMDTFDQISGRKARSEINKTRIEQNKMIKQFTDASDKLRKVWNCMQKVCFLY